MGSYFAKPEDKVQVKTEVITNPAPVKTKPWEKAVEKPATPAPTVVAPKSVNQVVNNISAVKQMQTAIIGLSKQFLQLRDLITKDALPFATYLTNSFILKSPIKGEIDPQPKNKTAQEVKEVKQAPQSEFDKLINSLQTIGKNDTIGADGDWGAKTNNALKNVVAIFNGMKKFTETFHLSVKFPEELDKLNKLIPQDPKTMPEKEKTAAEITKLISDITEKIPEFISKVQSSQVLKNPISVSYQNIQPAKLDEKSQEIVNLQPNLEIKKIPTNLSDPKSNTVSVMLSNLADQISFDKFLKDNNIMIGDVAAVNDPKSKNQVLDFIEAGIKNITNVGY